MTAISVTSERRLQSHDCIRAALLAGSMILVAAVIAAATSAFVAAPARAWLNFPFAGITPDFGSVISIWTNNTGLLAALLAAVIVPQLALRTSAGSMRVLVVICDGIVSLAFARQVFLVGVTIGAYGSRGLGAVLPHGPIELTAYSLGLSLYVAAHRERLCVRRAVAIGALSLLTLTIAAVVEVMA